MKLLNIDETVEGMVIGKDIISPSGQCLVLNGTVLTNSIIKSLKRNVISEIYIKEATDEKSFTDEEIKKAEKVCFEEVEERFYKKPEERMMKIIFNEALRSEALEYLKCKKAC